MTGLAQVITSATPFRWAARLADPIRTYVRFLVVAMEAWASSAVAEEQITSSLGGRQIRAAGRVALCSGEHPKRF